MGNCTPNGPFLSNNNGPSSGSSSSTNGNSNDNQQKSDNSNSGSSSSSNNNPPVNTIIQTKDDYRMTNAKAFVSGYDTGQSDRQNGTSWDNFHVVYLAINYLNNAYGHFDKNMIGNFSLGYQQGFNNQTFQQPANLLPTAAN